MVLVFIDGLKEGNCLDGWCRFFIWLTDTVAVKVYLQFLHCYRPCFSVDILFSRVANAAIWSICYEYENLEGHSSLQSDMGWMGDEAWGFPCVAILMEEAELKAFYKQLPLHSPRRVGCYVLEDGWGLPLQPVAHLVNVYEPLQWWDPCREPVGREARETGCQKWSATRKKGVKPTGNWLRLLGNGETLAGSRLCLTGTSL